ncbi:hypothetical protein B0H19DRAFT_916562 [Mycena capillaripes]|nr:hypothetical protein B0H19DRAFT_916562 [Mycena capillaripes]
MSSPPAKRARTEKAPITRSKLWHSDGSVILQVENTQFRVHWSVLALNSSFFRDMQALPQPPDQPSVEGCPIVELSDAVADVDYLLKALYTPTFLEQTAVPFPVIAAFVRLGRKYDFKDLLDSALARLAFHNPSTLEAYDAQFNSTRIMRYPALPFEIVTLASENNILTVLPCAYWSLVLNFNSLFDGIRRDDGTLASLPLSDLRRCVGGRERLLTKQFQSGYTLGWLRKWEFNDCSGPTLCPALRGVAFRWVLDRMHAGGLGDLHSPTGVNGEDWRGLVCEACYDHIAKSAAAGRKKMWEELPALFDLPVWQELKNDF